MWSPERNLDNRILDLLECVMIHYSIIIIIIFLLTIHMVVGLAGYGLGLQDQMRFPCYKSFRKLMDMKVSEKEHDEWVLSSNEGS